MKRADNRIAVSSRATPGAEGYVFDGVDGSQMAFWTCSVTTPSAPHVHGFDEYMIVVQGCYTLIIGDKRTPVRAGEECFIPRGCCMAAKWRREPEPSTHLAGTVRTGRMRVRTRRMDAELMVPARSFRAPRWYTIPVRVCVVTFVGTLICFAVGLLFGILGTVIVSALRGVHPDMRSCLSADRAAHGAGCGEHYFCARAGDGDPALPPEQNAFGNREDGLGKTKSGRALPGRTAPSTSLRAG